MAIAFGYTESTNTVAVTGGTSFTPATFADFVTADRAGTDTDLLVAGSPASNLALTYAVRPVEDLAILVKCIVANKTAEADFIFITGKDFRGAAQTESIDVTADGAGPTSHTSTKYWSEITTLDCSDNAAGGGAVWGDGDLSVTQDVWGVIWDYGNFQYRVDSHFDIGNGATATYFKTTGSVVFATTSMELTVTSSATWKCGEVSSNEPSDSAWINIPDLKFEHYSIVDSGGTLLAYATTFVWNNPAGSYTHFYISGDATLKRTNIFGQIAHGGVALQVTHDTTIDDVYFNVLGRCILQATPTNPPDVWIFNQANANSYLELQVSAETILKNLKVVNPNGRTLYIKTNVNTLAIDCNDASFTTVQGNPAPPNAGSIYRQYTCNIHVVDKDGTNLQNVLVACEDTNSDAAFTTQTTAADGTITEQTVSYRRYYYSGGDQVQTYSPHKFTLSKAGYETLILDAVTVDGPIDWHLELQPAKRSGAGKGVFIF